MSSLGFNGVEGAALGLGSPSNCVALSPVASARAESKWVLCVGSLSGLVLAGLLVLLPAGLLPLPGGAFDSAMKFLREVSVWSGNRANFIPGGVPLLKPAAAGGGSIAS